MKVLYCAQEEKEGLSLRTVSETPPTRLRRNAPILVSRLDCDLRILEVPPLPAREIRAFIRYRLRTLYPGNPDDTHFDYRLAGRDEKRRAIVYLMRRETMEQYRPFAKRRRLIAADQLLDAVLGKRRGGVVLFVREAYVEYLRYADGGLCESSMVLVNGRLDLPVACRRDLEEGPDPPADPPVWVSERRNDSRIRSVLVERCRSERIKIRSLQEVLVGIRMPPWRRNRMALFGTRRSGAVSPPVVALVLVVFILVLGGWNVRSIVAGYERRYEQVRSKYLQRLALFDADNGSDRRIAELRDHYHSLADRRPIDIYELLCKVADAAARVSGENRTTIEGITLNDDALTIEGSAADPFRLADMLSSRNGFSQVRIMQAVPGGEGRPVRFTMRGRYDDR